jgi:hypothetical protein
MLTLSDYFDHGIRTFTNHLVGIVKENCVDWTTINFYSSYPVCNYMIYFRSPHSTNLWGVSSKLSHPINKKKSLKRLPRIIYFERKLFANLQSLPFNTLLRNM